MPMYQKEISVRINSLNRNNYFSELIIFFKTSRSDKEGADEKKGSCLGA